MRRITILLTCLILLFSGYWFFAARTITGQTTDVLGQLETEGWQIDHAGLGTGGFPFRFRTRLRDATLTDPSGQIGWQGDEVSVSAPSYWPTEVTATLPNQQSLTLAGEVIDIASTDMQATATVAASTEVPLDRLALLGRDVTLTLPSGWTLRLDSLDAALTDEGAAPTYSSTASLAALEIPDLAAFAQAAELPQAINQITLDGTLRFAAPLDLEALSAEFPPIEVITINGFDIQWHDTGLSVDGEVAPGPSGLLSGSLTLTVRNWERLLGGAAAAGLIDPSALPSYVSTARMLSGGAADLTAPLTLDNGDLRMGFIPLGRVEF